MIGLRVVAVSGLSALSLFSLSACNREPEEPVAEIIVDLRVAQVDRLDIGRSPGGWIVTAYARDQRGLVEQMSFEPVDQEGDILRFDLIGEMTEQVAQGIAAPEPQSGIAATFIRDADLVDIRMIEVRAVDGAQTIAVPQRVVAQ